VACTCECGNKPSGSINCGGFLDYLQTGWLLKKNSAQWSKLVSNIFIAHYLWTDTQAQLCVYLYVYLFMLGSVYFTSCSPHADQNLPNFPTPHKVSSRPALENTAP
jgi:hypothetical protein